MAVPPWARDARVRCGIPLRAMAVALGVCFSTIARWENGQNTPTGPRGAAYLRVIAGLARHLEVPEEPR